MCSVASKRPLTRSRTLNRGWRIRIMVHQSVGALAPGGRSAMGQVCGGLGSAATAGPPPAVAPPCGLPHPEPTRTGMRPRGTPASGGNVGRSGLGPPIVSVLIPNENSTPGHLAPRVRKIAPKLPGVQLAHSIQPSVPLRSLMATAFVPTYGDGMPAFLLGREAGTRRPPGRVPLRHNPTFLQLGGRQRLHRSIGIREGDPARAAPNVAERSATVPLR
jgi:hypothetical protein